MQWFFYMKKTNYRQLGQKGEKIAQYYLKKYKYTIIDTNVKLGYHELDIVAQKNNITIFVEVKTKAERASNVSSLVLSRSQIKNLKKAMAKYCYKNYLNFANVRLDLLQLNHKTNNLITVTYYKDIL